MVTARFTDYDYARAPGLWQYDYGQLLRIEGLSLDPTVEVHFSIRDTGGEAEPGRPGYRHTEQRRKRNSGIYR